MMREEDKRTEASVSGLTAGKCVAEEMLSASAEQTRAWAAQLGHALEPGDVLALWGELGAGKTTFCQGLAQGLEIASWRRVVSPTFTLINEYTGRLPFYHFDFYRLEHPGELEELGFRDYFWGNGVCAVEWAERWPELLPERTQVITIEVVGDETRRLKRWSPCGRLNGEGAGD